VASLDRSSRAPRLSHCPVRRPPLEEETLTCLGQLAAPEGAAPGASKAWGRVEAATASALERSACMSSDAGVLMCHLFLVARSLHTWG
jgi:hypothetical protein